MIASAPHSTLQGVFEAIPELLGHPRLHCKTCMAAAGLAGQDCESKEALLCKLFVAGAQYL